MNYIVTITSQGQLTIPKDLLRHFGIEGSTKAKLVRDGDKIIVEPKNDFWSLAGSLKSSVKLSDEQLRQARKEFSKTWGKND